MSCWPGIGPRAGNAEKLRRPGAGGHPERDQGPVPVRAKPGEQLVEHRVRDLLRNPLRDLRAEQARLLLRERLHRVVVRVRPTRPGQRERVHDRPGPGLQVIGVEAAADRLAVRNCRRREPSRRRPLPRHHLGRGRLSAGLAGELEVPAEVPGLDPRRLVPRDIHGPREPEPAQQRQRIRPLRRRGPPGRLQVPQELRHRHDTPAARAAQVVRLPQIPGLDKRPCCGNHQRSEIPGRVCLFSRHGTRP